MAIKSRLEENGFYLSKSEHWELIPNRTVYICKSSHGGTLAMLHIPMDIVRHLNLINLSKIDVAIRVSEKK